MGVKYASSLAAAEVRAVLVVNVAPAGMLLLFFL